MLPIHLSSTHSKKFIEPAALIGFGVLAGSKRLIQYFPGASSPALLLYAGAASTTLVMSESSENRRIFMITGLVLHCIFIPQITKAWEGSAHLSFRTAFRFTLMEASLFVGIEFFYSKVALPKQQQEEPIEAHHLNLISEKGRAALVQFVVCCGDPIRPLTLCFLVPVEPERPLSGYGTVIQISPQLLNNFPLQVLETAPQDPRSIGWWSSFQLTVQTGVTYIRAIHDASYDPVAMATLDHHMHQFGPAFFHLGILDYAENVQFALQHPKTALCYTVARGVLKVYLQPGAAKQKASPLSLHHSDSPLSQQWLDELGLTQQNVLRKPNQGSKTYIQRAKETFSELGYGLNQRRIRFEKWIANKLVGYSPVMTEEMAVNEVNQMIGAFQRTVVDALKKMPQQAQSWQFCSGLSCLLKLMQELQGDDLSIPFKSQMIHLMRLGNDKVNELYLQKLFLRPAGNIAIECTLDHYLEESLGTELYQTMEQWKIFTTEAQDIWKKLFVFQFVDYGFHVKHLIDAIRSQQKEPPLLLTDGHRHSEPMAVTSSAPQWPFSFNKVLAAEGTNSSIAASLEVVCSIAGPKRAPALKKRLLQCMAASELVIQSHNSVELPLNLNVIIQGAITMWNQPSGPFAEKIFRSINAGRQAAQILPPIEDVQTHIQRAMDRSNLTKVNGYWVAASTLPPTAKALSHGAKAATKFAVGSAEGGIPGAFNGVWAAKGNIAGLVGNLAKAAGTAYAGSKSQQALGFAGKYLSPDECLIGCVQGMIECVFVSQQALRQDAANLQLPLVPDPYHPSDREEKMAR